jgi:drug/metabolite transporter (DMT)-like permease
VTVLLALGSALAYGLSDFLGGLISRRTSAWPVAFVAQVGAAAGALVLALLVRGDPSITDFLRGALAGLGSGAGSAFLYRGFAAGRMGVVAPVSAVGAAVLPVLVAVGVGERPAMLVWLGVLLALPAIWLVSREPTSGPGGAAAGLVDGILAGLSFGLLFAAMAQVPDGAGLGPVAVAQVTATVTIAVTAAFLGERWLPTHRTEGWGLLAGLLATAAVVLFLLATHSGLLTVAAVLTSLYPAFTVLLAATALREQIHRAQAAGLLLSGVAVALVAAG